MKEIRFKSFFVIMVFAVSIGAYGYNYGFYNGNLFLEENQTGCLTNCSGSNYSKAMVFRPVSATINDSYGSFTSEQFDCANMLVTDNRTSVTVTVAGDKMVLSPSKYNEDTYTFTAYQNSTRVEGVAFRSSNTNKIFVVIMTITNGDKSVKISFKPD